MIISKTTPKERVLELGKVCDKSNHCCTYSTGFLADDDASRIAKFLNISEEELIEEFLDEVTMFNTSVLRPKSIETDKPHGPCVFLDNEIGCKIHDVKPLHCKLYTCQPHGFDLTQWFYLNYLVDPKDPQSIRDYAMFLKSNKPIPGGELEDLVPDARQREKILNYEVFTKEK